MSGDTSHALPVSISADILSEHGTLSKAKALAMSGVLPGTHTSAMHGCEHKMGVEPSAVSLALPRGGGRKAILGRGCWQGRAHARSALAILVAGPIIQPRPRSLLTECSSATPTAEAYSPHLRRTSFWMRTPRSFPKNRPNSQRVSVEFSASPSRRQTKRQLLLVSMLARSQLPDVPKSAEHRSHGWRSTSFSDISSRAFCI